MKCSYNNKELKKTQAYEKGVSDAVNTMIIIVTYVLSCYGYKGKRIQDMIHKIEYTADSINKGYITHQDLEDTLWEEYQIRLQKHKSWCEGSIEE